MKLIWKGKIDLLKKSTFRNLNIWLPWILPCKGFYYTYRSLWQLQKVMRLFLWPSQSDFATISWTKLPSHKTKHISVSEFMVFLLLALLIDGCSTIISVLNAASLWIFITELLLLIEFYRKRVTNIKIKGFLNDTPCLYFLLILLHKLKVKYYTSKNKWKLNLFFTNFCPWWTASLFTGTAFRHHIQFILCSFILSYPSLFALH